MPCHLHVGVFRVHPDVNFLDVLNVTCDHSDLFSSDLGNRIEVNILGADSLWFAFYF